MTVYGDFQNQLVNYVNVFVQKIDFCFVFNFIVKIVLLLL